MRAAALVALLGAVAIAAAATVGSSGAVFTGQAGSGANAFTTDTLLPPTALSASAGGADSISLSWTASASTYAAGYNVWRSLTSGSGYVFTDSVAGGATSSYADSGLACDTSYFYVLESFYQNWISVFSNEATATSGGRLVDTGLVVRYYLDEAAIGQGPANALDAAANALDLVIEYAGQPAYTEVAGNRGLEWTTVGGAGGPYVPGGDIGSTKVYSQLHGSTDGVIELVLDITAGSGPSRFSYIGSGSESGRFALTYASSIDRIYFYVGQSGEAPVGYWDGYGIDTAGRIVIHGVLDTTNAVAEDRLRLYIDGVRKTRTGGVSVPLSQNYTLNFATTDNYSIGNRDPTASDQRSPDGIIYYAAMYDAVPSDADIGANKDALLASDDSPPTAVTGVSPSSGPIAGGTAVTVTGSGFSGATSVTFSGAAATFAVDSDTQITATAPAHAAGTVDVQVTASCGTSANTAADDYSYVGGQTYYVRTDGNDANAGTSNTPAGAWLTIQKAADTMVAGDTVKVQPGTYQEQVTPANGGTAANRITYQASGSVVIDGGNVRCYAFELLSVDYIVIEGFEITDQPDCNASDGAILLSGDSDFVTIRHNVIHDTGRDAIAIWDTNDNALIENNLIYNIDDDGITPSGSGNHVIRNNTFYNTGVTTGAGGFVLEGGHASNLFENNIFWASPIWDTSLGTFNYNDYNGGALPGTNNISSDPLFVNAAANDFHLSHIAAGQGSDSPAIDVGSTTAAALGLDTRTTRTDSVTDSGIVDLGYHSTSTPPPAITSLSPTSGPAAGGTSVVITGTDFTGATAVTFGGTAAGYVVDSDTQITATSPAHAAGTVDVLVTTPSGASANTAADDYTFTPSVTLLGSWGVGLTHTVQAGSERLLVFIAGYENGASPTLSAVTYGGQALTKVNDVTTGTTTIAYVEIWILGESGIAAATDSTFIPTWTSAPSSPMYSHAFFGGVDQATPTGAQATASTASSTPNPITTAALATSNGDMVIAGAVAGNNGSYAPQNGFIEGNDQTAGATTTMGTSYKAASGSPETPSMLHSGPNRQVIAAVVLRAVP